MVALAFLIPLGLVVQQLARERAFADAERQTAVVVAVLTVTTDPLAIERAIASTGGPAVSRVSVHNLGEEGLEIGTGHAAAKDLAHAADQAAPVTATVAGGLSYLEPVDVGSGRTAVVEVFIPEDELSDGVSGAWWALSAVALGLVIASVWVGDRLAAKVTASARQLAGAAGALSEGYLDVRLDPSGPRELAEASFALNVMADRIMALLTNERELVADLSHRLRTPLTALRLDAETLDDSQDADRIRDAIAALEVEIDKLIRAMREPIDAHSPTPDRGERSDGAAASTGEQGCDVAEVVRDRMMFWSAVAGDQERDCKAVGTDRPAPVHVAKSELAAALDALIGNVIRYTPQGVPFEVAVTRRDDGYVVLRVEDGGPGIPDPELALQRGESGQGSTGLGLDIVRRVAVEGNGTVNIGTSGTLGGASVVIVMADADPAPVEQPPQSRFGLVGRLSREPNERRRRGKPAP
ncbi:ATP-binding protein [Dactylosporangium cerinum]|jgi:signal transduction histidine kinase|uniref:Signal transduction histidine-protein kinase/phosphatase MprB n=2 Tax=Dactylosporangium TaxID=35753 RepID=A0A919UI20_9ACTN|nr:HAMP domain-containing sensor histidine kinase [Dactylosporangium siamense]GIG52120.1 two-component sensor histidine kinase [Dactylosporangium siamense]